MSLFTKPANDVWAGHNADGSARRPDNQDAQRWGSEIERVISALASTGGAIFQSKSQMDPSLGYPAFTMAWVLGDSPDDFSGIYQKIGASGTGSWNRLGDLPYSFVVAIDSGAGTPNAIQASSALPVSTSALVLLSVIETNTASPVTVSFNGGAPLTVKSNSGLDVTAGGLIAGMVVMGHVSGSTFRLVNDEAIASLIYEARDEVAVDRAAAEAARDLAEQYASDAAAQANVPIYSSATTAAGLAIPVGITALRVNGWTSPGDGGDALYIAGTGTGYRGFISNSGTRGWDRVSRVAPVDEVITVGSGGQFATLQAAYDAVDRNIKSTKSITIQVLGHLTKSTTGYTLRADSPSGKQIKIRGVTPVQTALTGIVSVTGSPGDWSVTVTLANASGVAVGDFIRVKNVVPGYQSIYTYTGKPSIGELWMPRVPLGKIYTSGTTAIVGEAALTSHMTQNDIILLKGQGRRVNSIDSETQFTMATGALAADIASDPRLNWWWFARGSGNGFVQVTGTAVVGTSTSFLTMVSPGDYIMVQNGSIGRIASIQSNTALTLEKDMGTTSASRYWAPVIRGHHHEGGWRITAVNGNQVTWKNTSRSSYPPPVNRITGGDVSVLKSSIQNTGAGSGVQVDTFADIDDLAIVGDQGTGSFGVNAYGDGRGKAGVVRLGPGTILLGYEYCFYGEMGALYADEVSFCGATNDGCYPVNGTAVVAINAVANGNGRRGFTAYGNFCNYTGSRGLGNGNDGLWCRQGHCLAESFVGEDNGRGGIWVVGTAGCEAVQSRIMGNQFGVVNENGGYGRYSGAMIASNPQRGIYNLFGRMELIDATVVASGVGYWARSLADTKLEQAGFYKNTTNKDVDTVARTDESLVTYVA
jgi:hypothetical protein